MFKLFEKYQRWFEIGFWLALTFFIATFNATSVIIEYARSERSNSIELWMPFVWEYSSAIIILVLIPVVNQFDKQFPLSSTRPFRNLFYHLLFTIPFSLTFIAAIVALRKLVYFYLEQEYSFGPLLIGFIYEYRKLFVSYLLIVSIFYIYRFIVSRLKGEANFVAEGEQLQPAELPKRLLVKKLGREFIINIKDIDWIEAAGNYVNLHLGDQIYPLRSTMANMQKALSPEHFARIHRSYFVNLDRIQQMQPLETGDTIITLHTGLSLKLSRRYKHSLKQRLDFNQNSDSTP